MDEINHYLLLGVLLTTTLEVFARVCKAEQRIEECMNRAKSEASLADYQVRTWEDWHHHQALSLLATWFLTQETSRGKKPDARFDHRASAHDDSWHVNSSAGSSSPRALASRHQPPLAMQRGGKAVPLETVQVLATSTL